MEFCGSVKPINKYFWPKFLLDDHDVNYAKELNSNIDFKKVSFHREII